MVKERAEAAERRAKELEYQLRMQQEQQYVPKQKQRYEIEEEEDDFDIADDSYVEGRQVKKLLKKMDQRLKMTAKQLEEQAQQNAIKYAESNLKNQFRDFDSIVTEENLEKLKYAKAPLYRSIMANPDLYDRGYSAYEAIRSLGEFNNEYEYIDKKIEDNKKKPISSAAAAPQIQDNPLSRHGDYDRRVLTEQRKEELRKQVATAKMMR